MSLMNEIQQYLYENPPKIIQAINLALIMEDDLILYRPAFALCWGLYKDIIKSDEVIYLATIFVQSEFIEEYTEICDKIRNNM